MHLEPLTRILDCRTVADIHKKLVKWGKRNPIFRRFHAKEDTKMIATWRLDLDKILQVFNVCFVA